MLVINRTGLVQQQMTQLVHERERLLGFPRPFLDYNHRTGRVVKAETESRVLLGNLPLPVVAVAAKHQHATRFQSSPVGVEVVLVTQAEPLASDAGRLARVLPGISLAG